MDNSYREYRGKLSTVNKDVNIEDLLAYEEAKLATFRKELKIAQHSIKVMNLKKRAFRKRFFLHVIFSQPLG